MISTLAEILGQVKRLPERGYAIYLPVGGYPWQSDSLCACLAHDVYDERNMPDIAKEYRLQLALTMDLVVDIAQNAKLQKSNVSPDDLVRAFNYYWKHDAFINLSGINAL